MKKILTIVSIMVLVVSMGLSVMETEKLKEIERVRDTSLDERELRKLEVIGEIARLYTVKDEKTYKEAKKKSKCTEELKSRLYGSSFDGTKYFYGEEVRVLDAQYSMEGEESYYILSEVKKGGASYILRSLVYVSGGQIYEIINI